MAIVWGAYEGHQAVGVEVSMSPATVTKDTASVTLTWKVWTKTDGWDYFSDNQTMTMSNAIADTQAFVLGNEAPGDAFLVWTGTQSVSTSYSVTVAKTLTAVVSGQVNGGTPSSSASITIPKRPPQVPSAATVVTATRVSDTQMSVAWTRPANASSDSNIWTNVKVNRRSATATAWATVATLAGTATSWSDTTTGANNTYQYQVVPTNVSGSGTALTVAAYLDTTPAAPTNVVATKTGADIVVTWTDNARADAGYEVLDNGVLIATTAADATSYTHTAPSTVVTHQYTVRAKTDNPVLYSGYGTSNTVQLLAPPNAPTGMSPNGSTVDGDLSLTLTWTHNPVDTTAQREKQIQYRRSGVGTWTTAAITASTAQSWTLTPNDIATILSGGSTSTIEWQVRTSGGYTTADTTDMSPWSATASFTVSHKPTATLNVPIDGAVVATPSLAVTWGYYQPDSHVQSAWQVEILQGAVMVASGAGTSETSWTTPTVLENGGSYTVRVRVRESSGLWSDYDTAAITVAFPAPLAPVIVPTWLPELGYVRVDIQAQSNGVAPDAVSMNVLRSLDGGVTWDILATDLAPTTEYQDWTAPAAGSIVYRVQAVSALPSMAAADTSLVIPVQGRTVYISGGPGYTTCARVRLNARQTVTSGRERVLNEYDGRTYPVVTSSTQLTESSAVSAVALTTAEAGDDLPLDGNLRAVLEELFNLPSPHLYRDTTGRTMWCALSPLVSEVTQIGTVSFTATRVAPPDDESIAAIWDYESSLPLSGWAP